MTDKPVRPAATPKPKRAPAAKKTEIKKRPAAKPVKAAAPKATPASAPVAPTPTPTPAPIIEKAPRKAESAPKSVAEQLGGAVGFAALSERVSQLLVGDPRVNHALFGTPQSEVIEKVKHLLTSAADEVEHDLHALFAPLREKGFKQGQFDHLLTHIKAASAQLGHPDELARTIAEATEKARKQVFKS